MTSLQSPLLAVQASDRPNADSPAAGRSQLAGRRERPVRAGARRPRHRISPAGVSYRAATPVDARALLAMIDAYRQEGQLLPRTLDDLREHADRFVIAHRDGQMVGCAELASLSDTVAEVRSLVVDRAARSLGIGRQLVARVERRGRRQKFERLCAFTHDAGYFLRLGFVAVAHTAVPEKIAHDCLTCAQYRRCHQQAVVKSLIG